MTAAFTVLFGLASFAVDYGRVQLAKTELRCAADAAARAAATGMIEGITYATNSAATVAAANKVDGTPVKLNTNQDIEFGTWDMNTRTFTVLSGYAQSDANAVRVTVHRTTERGNPIELVFGAAIGKSTCDVSATSIVTIESSGPGIVGLDYINMSDKKTNSYKSSKGTPTTFENKGSIFSNGNIQLKNGVIVNGDARPGTRDRVTMDGSCIVTGITSPLTFALMYAMPNPGTYATANDNGQLGSYLTSKGDFKMTSGSLTVAGGNYYVRDFTVAAQGNINFLTPSTIWVNGTLTMTGGITTASNLPANLKIRMVSGSASNNAAFSGATNIYCDYYGPRSPLTIAGNADFYGRIIAKSIDVSGSGELHYDESAVPTAGAIATVK